MTLTLRAVSLNDHPLSRPLSAQFNAAGGSVGRGDHNTLALPDPERHISRQQAEISVNANGYQIRNIGSANPITVRGEALARGESTPLTHSDQIRIGGYLLEVIHEPDAVALNPARNAALIPTPRPARPAPVAVAADALPPPRRALLPDDFNPFAAPPAEACAEPACHPGDLGGFADLIPSAAPASIDELFKLGAASPNASADALADFMAGRAPAGVPGSPESPAPLSTDPLALFGFTGADAPAAATNSVSAVDSATADAHVPELRAAFVPPALRRWPTTEATPTSTPTPAAATVAASTTPAPAPAPWHGDPHELWLALCDGAGVTAPASRGVDPELMRAVGGVLHAAVAGTLQLMRVRATAKHELRAPVTVIQASQNNPLKFSPDARAALEQLLLPPQRGFLDAPTAMADAMHDLVGHTLATMAGTRAALEGVIDRFAPPRLQARLAPPSVLDSVLPMQRKARLWALYQQEFEGLRDAATDDFEALFGRAFLVAYEAQIERLRRAAEPAEPIDSDPTAAAIAPASAPASASASASVPSGVA